MGAVYLAIDSQLNRNVGASKSHFSMPEKNPNGWNAFREARSARGSITRIFCTVFDAGEIAGRPFITMAFITGKPLEDVFDSDNLLPVTQAVEIVRKTALAVQKAHELSIIHRDLKPANVMITRTANLSLWTSGWPSLSGATDAAEARLTQEGALLGTPKYMAPEQVNGDQKAIDPRQMLHLVILFELLTGKTPYSGPILQLLSQIASAPVPQVKAFRPEVSDELTSVCYKAMAKKPSDRFARRPSLRTLWLISRMVRLYLCLRLVPQRRPPLAKSQKPKATADKRQGRGANQIVFDRPSIANNRSREYCPAEPFPQSPTAQQNTPHPQCSHDVWWSATDRLVPRRCGPTCRRDHSSVSFSGETSRNASDSR
ncbi:MAG: serine/threonine-protein kinase [Planctomycetaceae bacterium]